MKNLLKKRLFSYFLLTTRRISLNIGFGVNNIAERRGNVHIVENIETYCKNHGTSMSKFEESCELGHGTIRLWKLETQMPSIRSLMKIANFTGIPIDQWTKEGGVA